MRKLLASLRQPSWLCKSAQVPAVTELIIAELLYLNYESSDKVRGGVLSSELVVYHCTVQSKVPFLCPPLRVFRGVACGAGLVC